MAKILAVCATAVGIVVGLISIAGAYPEGWWPRERPFRLGVTVTSVERYETWVVPRPIDELDGAPPVVDDCASEDRMQWAEALGGIPREIGVWVTIVSNRDDSIVITDLDIDVQRESFQGTGTNVELCGPGGGGVPIHYIGVDLDVDPPSVTMYGTERPEEDPDPQPEGRYSIALRKGDAEELFITAGSYSADQQDFDMVYEWTASLVILVGGREQLFQIDNDGSPFRTATCLTDRTWTTSAPTPDDQVLLCPLP